MTMPRSVVLVLLAGLLAFASPVRAGEVEDAVEAANAKMIADYAAGNANAIAEAYAEDGMMLPPDATVVSGREAIAALWKSWIDQGLKDLTLKTTKIESAGDLAYEIGDFSLQVTGEDGKMTTAPGNYVVVWKKGSDGAWRLLVDTWNDAPVPTTD
jgi:uncharacterized protein (TIGR02246 family)